MAGRIKFPINYWPVGLLLGLLLLSGCQSPQLLEAQRTYQAGNYDLAAQRFGVLAEKEADNKTLALLAHLEHGATLRASGQIEASNKALARADALVAQFESQPEVSVSRQTMAILSNPNVLPYKGTHYDKIMLSCYRALNYLEMGEPDSARVELRRVYNRQRQAVQDNEQEILEAISELEDAARQQTRRNAQTASPSVNLDRAMQDDVLQHHLGRITEDLSSFQAYAPYANPYAEWLQAVYFLHANVDNADTERARVAWRRLRGMVPDNGYLGEDLALAEARSRGNPARAITYVLWETGTSPMRGETRIALPLYLINDQVDYIGASFPTLEMNPVYASALNIYAEGTLYQPALLCDMDSVIAEEFRQQMPLVIAQTLLSAAAKATAAYFAQASTEEGIGRLLVRAASVIYQESVNHADRRTWASLPKHVYYARFPTPPTGRLELQTPPSPPLEIFVQPNASNLVLVKTLNPGSLLRHQTITF